VLFRSRKSNKRRMPQSRTQRPPRQRGRLRQQTNRRRSNGRKLRPTLVVKAHALISQSITSVNVKQINIAPTVSAFPADVL